MGLAQEIVTGRRASVYMDAYARIPQDEREVNGTSLDPLYPMWVCLHDIDPGYAAVIERLPDLHRTRGWGAPQALDY